MNDIRCETCGALCPDGLPDVFCPVCALQCALAGNSQAQTGGGLRSWLKRLKPLWGAVLGTEAATSKPQTRPAQFAAELTPGDLVADYEIIESIGGNMGLVFKARHRLLHKLVALKLLPAEPASDPDRFARIQREIRAMGQMVHPNLVAASDARRVDNRYLVAMEWIDGINLQDLLRSHGPLAVTDACEIARQASLGLHFAQEHSLVHRDVKPSNLMLVRGGTVKLIDMGLALISDENSDMLTQAGVVLGTLNYCAPEQWCNASQVDIRTDIYALGCTLYHLLTGKPPYRQWKTVPDLMQAHLHKPFPSLAAALPGSPAGLESVLSRMTAKDREARFSTPREVIEALEQFSKGADLASLVPAEATLDLLRAKHKSLSSPEVPRGNGEGAPPKFRLTRRAALMGLGAAVTGGAIIAFASKRNPVVVLMDTTAEGGIYDQANRKDGTSNASEVRTALEQMGFVPPLHLVVEPIYLKWRGQARVRKLRPDLVIIHRSSFYHPVNADLNIPPKREEGSVDQKKWEAVYRLADDKLIDFMGYVGSHVSKTQFLIYSRGTDPQWPDLGHQKKWRTGITEAYSELEGRIWTMVIPAGFDGSFRRADTRAVLRANVVKILKLPQPPIPPSEAVKQGAPKEK